MKKKKMSNYEKFTIWMIVAVTIAVIGYITFFFIPAEPHFKITKEECTNETILDAIYPDSYCHDYSGKSFTIQEKGYSPDDLYDMDCYNYLISQNYSKNNLIINKGSSMYYNDTAELICFPRTAEIKNGRVYITNPTQVVVKKGYYPKVYDFKNSFISANKTSICNKDLLWGVLVNITTGEIVCSPVDVDEIRIYGNEITSIYLGQSLDCDTKLNKCFDKIEVISKKDLTKKWLNEKCECIEKEYTCPYFFYKMYNYSSFGRTNFVCYSPQMIDCLTSYHIGACSGQAKDPIVKCQKYKCFGDYKVEVK